MFAWIDLAYVAGGVAFGYFFYSKITAFAQTVQADITKLKADVAALEAKIGSFNTTVKTDVTNVVDAVKAKL